MAAKYRARAQGLLQAHHPDSIPGSRVGSGEGMLLRPPHSQEGQGGRY